MKTTLIIGIALIIALFVSVFTTTSLIVGAIAFVIVGFQTYMGYYYEGKRSVMHALIGPALLGAFLITSKAGMLGGIFLLVWIGAAIYIGYKAEL